MLDNSVSQQIHVLPDGSSYQGNLIGGKKQGYGILTDKDGVRYEGEFDNDAMNGHFTVAYPDGARFEGYLEDGLYSGYGILTDANGVCYEGDFVKGAFSGKGTQTFPDGAKYEGWWRNGQRQGNGTFTYVGGTTLEAIWHDNRPDGNVTLRYSDGRTYQGEFHKGAKEGNILLKNHKQYLSILDKLQKLTAQIVLVQIDGPDPEDPVVNTALEMMPLVRKEVVDEWFSTIAERGRGAIQYTFTKKREFFGYLKTFDSFFLARDTLRGFQVQQTSFGYDDIAFLDSGGNLLFYTTTHEGYAYMQESLIS